MMWPLLGHPSLQRHRERTLHLLEQLYHRPRALSLRIDVDAVAELYQHRRPFGYFGTCGRVGCAVGRCACCPVLGVSRPLLTCAHGRPGMVLDPVLTASGELISSLTAYVAVGLVVLTCLQAM